MNLVTRDMDWEPLERSGEPGESDGRTLEGYAAVFDQPTEINSFEGRFTETIARGAFRKTLREKKKPVMQFQHGRDSRVGALPIGVFEELAEDDHGLLVRGRLFDSAEPIREAIAGGAVTGMSFSFRVVRDEWRDAAGKPVKGDEIYRLLYEPGDRGPLQRTVREVQLWEAGPVVQPAYAGTSVMVRSDDDEIDREALVAEYRQTMVDLESEDDSSRDNAGEALWLMAEARHKADCNEWLRAETGWLTEVAVWLTAEKTSRDAARKGTSPDPEDAARKGTSDRDKKKDNTSQRDTPAPIKKGNVMTIDELRAREEELRGRIVELGDEHRDSVMPDDVQSEFDSAETEITSVRSQIKAIEARVERMKAYAVSTPAAREGGSDKGTPAFHKKSENIYDLDALRMDSNSPEDFADKLRDNAARAIEAARFTRTVAKESAQERASELLDVYDDESGTLAKRMLVTGSPLYERAFGKAMKSCSLSGLTNDEQRAMSLGSDGAGGFAVPFQLDPTVILTSAGVVGDIRSIARVETIVGKEWQGILSTGISVTRDGNAATLEAGELGRQAEAAEANDNSFALTQPTVRAQRVQGFVPFSIEIDQDWGGLRSEITRMLADAKAREEHYSFAVGSGTLPFAEGFVTNASTLSAGSPSATADGLKAKLPAALYALEEALDPRWRANATFVANKAIYNLIRQVDTQGGANLWERIGAGTPAELLGYKALENSSMTSSYATTSKVLAFGDFKQFLIVDRVGMSVELVPHIFGAAGRPTGQRGVYAVWRNNSKLLVPAAIKVLTTLT